MSSPKKKIYIHILLDKARVTRSRPKVRMSAKEAFLLTEKELRRLNGLIRNKKITEEHLGNSIFENLRGEVNEHVVKNYVYDHFTAGYYSFLDIKEKMLKEKHFDYRGIKKYGYIISIILFDIKDFAEYIGKSFDSSYIFFIGGKSNVEYSTLHYFGTLQLLYHSILPKKMMDNKFALILSPVSLRLTLELKIQRIFGVAEFYDRKGNKTYTDHYFFFDFLEKNKSHFDLNSINIKIIQKIFTFCNNSVHKGIMPYYWQMYYATLFCSPLFNKESSKTKNGWTVSEENVKIKKYNELKQKLEKNLMEKFPKPKHDLYIHWILPEAKILSKD
jgi:hypothetical protein